MISSTSAPRSVSAAASSSAESSVGQNSRTHDSTTRTGLAHTRELLEEPDVALDEHPHVGVAEPKQGHALHAEPERKPRVPLQDVPDVLQYLRANHHPTP